MRPITSLACTPPEDGVYDVVVIGGSAGGFTALREVVASLPSDFPLPVVAMLHLAADGQPERVLQKLPLPVQRLQHGDSIAPGKLWTCPPASYVELLPDGTCVVSPITEGLMSRPIDRLFASTAHSFGARALGIVLSGMNNDGSLGARELKEAGGCILVQSPGDAQHADMPMAAIATGAVDLVVPTASIGEVITEFTRGSPRHQSPSELRAIEAAFGNTSEVARAACNVDWQRTPLGPALNWSAHLKLLIRETLASAHASAIWWGPYLIEVYNDAWQYFLGSKHPDALGRPARLTWEPVWEKVGPFTEKVLHDGVAIAEQVLSFQVSRNGLTEDIFASFYGVPLQDLSGKTLGIRCTLFDITTNVVSHRRMQLQHALGLSMARATTRHDACTLAADAFATASCDVPFALLYLLDTSRRQATLACATGIDAGSSTAPLVVHTDTDSVGSWPLVHVVNDASSRTSSPHVVDSIRGQFPGCDVSASDRAVLVPLYGEPSGAVSGVLILGLAPSLRYDDAYIRFVEALSRQLTVGLGDARAKELERERFSHLSELSRAKTEFFSNVSHEFRTPLTLLLAPLEELAQKQDELPPDTGKELDIAVRNARRLLRLVNNLLDFSQVEAKGRLALLAPADLGTLTSDIVSAFSSAIEAAGLQLHVNIEPGLPLVPVNAAMWEQIVSNLVSNAFKFTFEGTISVTLKALRQHAELVVADTGVGIPQAEQASVFKRFHRVRGARARTAEGSGIGLSMVEDLVKRMGGQLTLRSREGKGSAFTIWMPLIAQPARRDPAGSIPVAPPQLAAALADEASRWSSGSMPPDVLQDVLEDRPVDVDACKRARLLVVDDNADLREYLRRLLEAQWHITLAADGAQALELARDHPPDLVLADVMMPGLDGFQLLERIRQDPNLSYVPLVLLTARASEEAAIEGLLAGADAYIAKPFSPRELTAKLQAALDRARADAALRESEAKYRQLIESMDEACAVVEVTRDARGDWSDFLFIQVNPAFIRQTGMPFPVGKTATQLLGTPNPRWAKLYGQAIDSGQPLRIEESEGTLGRTFDLNIFSVDTAQNRVAVIFADITERKRAENAIRESEEKFRQLFERIDEGFCIFEMIFEAGKPVDYRFIDVNPTFERHTGIVDAKGRRMREIAPDHEEHWFERYGQVALTGQAQRFEASAKALGDRWYEVHAYRIGEPAQHRVAVVFSDITQRRRDAAALRASEVRTRRQNEALQLAARGAPLEESLNLVAEMVAAETDGHARTAFYITERGGTQLHAVRGAGNMSDAFLDLVDRLLSDDGSLACGLAMPTGQPVMIRDVLEELRWAACHPIARAHDYRACWSFPIKTREHQPVGTWAIYFRGPREVTPDDLAFADIVTQTAAVIIASHQDKQVRERAEKTPQQSGDEYCALSDQPGAAVSQEDL